MGKDMRHQLTITILTVCSGVLAGVLALSPMTATAQQMAVSHTPNNTAKPQPASSAAQLTGKPVARVNGAVLTDRDLMREMYTLFPYARQHNGQVPAELEPQIRKGALQMLEFEELLYQEAVRRQVAVPAAKLKSAETDFRKQFGSPDEYKQFLNSEFNSSEKG